MTVPYLAWIYDGDLREALDAATWLDTTAELRKLGWQVTLLAVGPSGRQSVRGVEVECQPTVDRYFLRQAVFHDRALRYIRGLDPAPDVVMFHQISAPWMIGLRIGARRTASGLRRPLLALDIRSLHMPEKRGQGVKAWLRGSLMGLINRTGRLWVDGYLAITPRMARAVAVPIEKYWGEWPSGADPRLFSPAIASRQWPFFRAASTVDLYRRAALRAQPAGPCAVRSAARKPGGYVVPADLGRRGDPDRLRSRRSLVESRRLHPGAAARAACRGPDAVGPGARRRAAVPGRGEIPGQQPDQTVRVPGSRDARPGDAHRLPHGRGQGRRLRHLGGEF